MATKKNNITATEVIDLVQRQGYLCAISGRKLTPETASLDHIIPFSRGGEHSLGNVWVVDHQVNIAKGTMSLEEFVAMSAVGVGTVSEETIRRHSREPTAEDSKPQPRLRDRLRARIRQAGWPVVMVLMLVMVSGCSTRTIYVPPGEPVRLRETVRNAKVWVVDKDGELVGWIDCATLLPETTIKEAIVAVQAEEIAVTTGATLREALSRMLGQGFRSVPVVDDRMRLIGEITLRDIEAVTAETESP